MRKHISFAGMLLVTALLFAMPSKADSFVDLRFGDHWVDTHFGSRFDSINRWHGEGEGWAFGFGRENRIWKDEDGGEGTINWHHHYGNGWDRDGWDDHHNGDSGEEHTVTTTDPPAPSATTPEPASLALLGIGGLSLAALRRRKSV